MDLTVTITYSDVISQCGKLSAYEGRDRHDAAGADLYEKINITAQDEPLVSDYLSRSLVAVRERIEDMITVISSSSTAETWTLRTTQRRYDSKGYNGLGKQIGEALAASVMTAWLSYNGLEERARFYQTVFENEMKLISDNLHTKAAPTRPTT